MATSPHFNNSTNKQTQDMIESLVIQSIKVTGVDVVYIPRRFEKLDKVFGEDPLSYFKESFPIEMYLSTSRGYEGAHELLTKLGRELHYAISLEVSRRRFEEEAAKLPELTERPKQIDAPFAGDLIFFPLTKALYEVKFVETKTSFYQAGRLYTYRLDCQAFKYSQENLDTGNSELDKIETQMQEIINDGGEDITTNKPQPGTNAEIQTEADDIIDKSESDPFSNNNY